jgi:hypothetical protein
MGTQAPGLPGIGRQGQLEQEGGSLAPGLFLLLVHTRLSPLICSSTLSRQTDGTGVTCRMPSCQFTLLLCTHSLAVSKKWQCPLISQLPVRNPAVPVTGLLPFTMTQPALASFLCMPYLVPHQGRPFIPWMNHRGFRAHSCKVERSMATVVCLLMKSMTGSPIWRARARASSTRDWSSLRCGIVDSLLV